MPVKSLWGQVITSPGLCGQWLLFAMALKVGALSVSENHTFQADSSTESDIVDFHNRLGRWRETNATEGGDQNTREKREVTDSSPISPSACLSWFVYWEKKGQPTFFFAIKTQPGFSRDFISNSSLDAEANAHQWLRQSLWNISWVFSTFAVVIYSKARHANM